MGAWDDQSSHVRMAHDDWRVQGAVLATAFKSGGGAFGFEGRRHVLGVPLNTKFLGCAARRMH
eukprot:10554223-Alexandrium_andersonii.AAC.1